MTDCFHCGLPVPANAKWQVVLDDHARPVCCAGCEAIANTIISAGLDAYYRQRTSQGDAARLASELPLTLTQAAEIEALQPAADTRSPDQPPAASAAPGESDRIELAVEGMHCGACVWLLEQGLQSQPGVNKVVANLSSERLSIDIDTSRASLRQLLTVIARLGYRASPYQSDTAGREQAATTRASLQRLFVAGIGMMQVMMFALPGYLAAEGDIETHYAELLRWAALVLTTPVIIYSAWPFFRAAFQTLRFGRVGIDVPVSIGLLAAYSWSVVATVRGEGEVYFDSVSMFVFLLLLARHLQWLIRRKALARLDALGARTPKVATRWVNGERQIVSPAALRPGDSILVATGQAVPVDATLSRGSTLVDQSILTGESMPVRINAGQRVAAGSFVTGAAALMTVQATIADSAVSRLEALVARGHTEKPRWVMLADQVASWFVLAVIALAALTWLIWYQIDPSLAWPIAMTVLIVSCPCALSLATPSALSAATGGLLGQGILVTRADAIEALAGATDVVFDKTGTLTEGRPTVVAIDLSGDDTGLDELTVLALAAALEAGADHPVAGALRDKALQTGAALSGVVSVDDHRTGHGVAGRWDSEPTGSTEWRLGSAAWCDVAPEAVDWPARGPATEVYLARRRAAEADPAADSRWQPVARICLTDPLRANAVAVTGWLAGQGFRLHLVSGDQPAVVSAVASQLSIKSWRAAAMPEQKQVAVRELQAAGRKVIMVGDGLNDAPVLSLADVSLAVGQASDLARSAADIIALNADPQALTVLIRKARQTRRVIRQNLLLCLVYNLVAIPAAALGWVPPWLAALGMATSSWVVVANAARLWQPAHVPADNPAAPAVSLSMPRQAG